MANQLIEVKKRNQPPLSVVAYEEAATRESKIVEGYANRSGTPPLCHFSIDFHAHIGEFPETVIERRDRDFCR